MSRDTERDQASALPLPERKSPQRLDENILAHARTHAKQHAPQPGFAQRHGWMSGLAAASIVGVAVMITLPAQDEWGSTPAAEYEYEEDAGLAPAASKLSDANKRSTPVDSESDRIQEEIAGTATAGPALKARPMPNKPQSQGSNSSSMEQRADTGLRERKAQTKSFAQPMSGARPQRPSMEMAAPALPKAPPASLEDKAAHGQTQARAMTGGEASSELEACLALLRQDRREQAEDCYATLLENCTECALPSTLDAAAEQHITP